MATTGPGVFDRTLQESDHWFEPVKLDLWPDRSLR